MLTEQTTAAQSDTPRQTEPAPNLEAWLVTCRNAGATPPEIADTLISAGWSADHAATASLGSLRSTDQQQLLWFSLCWSAGLAAVGLTTTLHQMLSAYPNPQLAALTLTVSLVMAPIAFLCNWQAGRTEESSMFAVWSPSRRLWFGTLASCTAVVGLVRLISYLYTVMFSLLSPRGQIPLDGRDFAQVMVSLAVAIPMFTWSFTQWRRSNVAISGLRRSA